MVVSHHSSVRHQLLSFRMASQLQISSTWIDLGWTSRLWLRCEGSSLLIVLIMYFFKYFVNQFRRWLRASQWRIYEIFVRPSLEQKQYNRFVRVSTLKSWMPPTLRSMQKCHVMREFCKKLSKLPNKLCPLSCSQIQTVWLRCIRDCHATVHYLPGHCSCGSHSEPAAAETTVSELVLQREKDYLDNCELFVRWRYLVSDVN